MHWCWYCIATFVMALQTSDVGLVIWRFIAGIGIGVEFVTIDTYLSELVPRERRGVAFATTSLIGTSAYPITAFLAWAFVPHVILGLDGWRWVAIVGATGAIVAWFLRLALPESPRWLAQNGHAEEAERVTRMIETHVETQSGRALPPPHHIDGEIERSTGYFSEMFRPPYLKRTVMLIIFQVLQVVGYYGFTAWVPTLLLAQGINVTRTLAYTVVIAAANPLGALAATQFADRSETEVAARFLGTRDRDLRPALLAADRRDRHHGRRRPDRVLEHRAGLLAARLSVRALPDPDPRACRRLHLFLEPLQHDLCRLLHRLLPQALRNPRRLHLYRRRHGHRVPDHRDHGTAHDRPPARGDLALIGWPRGQRLTCAAACARLSTRTGRSTVRTGSGGPRRFTALGSEGPVATHKVLIMGASYGSLLASKLLFGGHEVTLICLPAEVEAINADGIRVRMPIKGRSAPVEIDSRRLPGKVTAAGPAGINPSDYDLVALAMQEPQYRSPGVRELLDAVAKSGKPCMSIMNMPPLPYLKRIRGLNTDGLHHCFTDASVWANFDPGR